ncbi:hypothetical protein CYMTET_18213 [Cymbomonas tetramitiformis]|uniref:Uncharacterized protein n=1 Tax=Cymbomonas tetramitiformis TaxID=36881 RepID=A0AAE0G8J9_9CHLO|nr:hypothetical protein CYMTET_18213 [Cymbomonas tetramitiformis]
MKNFKWETGACIFFLKAVFTVATFKYNKGDFLSSADREIPFPCRAMAPKFNTYASENQSPNVQYASMMLAIGEEGSMYDCEWWGTLGVDHEDATTDLVFDDSVAQHFQSWFGSTRPQFILIDSSGRFEDISPDESCGQCGTWSDAYYDALLAPYLSNGTASSATASPTSASSTGPPTMHTSASPTTTLSFSPTASPTSASSTGGSWAARLSLLQAILSCACLLIF